MNINKLLFVATLLLAMPLLKGMDKIQKLKEDLDNAENTWLATDFHARWSEYFDKEEQDQVKKEFIEPKKVFAATAHDLYNFAKNNGLSKTKEMSDKLKKTINFSVFSTTPKELTEESNSSNFALKRRTSTNEMSGKFSPVFACAKEEIKKKAEKEEKQLKRQLKQQQKKPTNI